MVVYHRRSIYLLLGIMNMYGMFVNPAFFAGNLPYPADAAVVKAFVDGWSPFAFEVVGLGTFMLWAGRKLAMPRCGLAHRLVGAAAWCGR